MPARFRTTLTMIVGMFRAFFGAGVANIGADAADFFHETRPPAHVGWASPTHLRAVNAQTRAVRHIAQTGIRAVIAFLGTLDTGADTGLMLLMRHGFSPPRKR